MPAAPSTYYYTGESSPTLTPVPLSSVTDPATFQIYKNGLLLQNDPTADYTYDSTSHTVSFASSLVPTDKVALVCGYVTGSSGSTYSAGPGIIVNGGYISAAVDGTTIGISDGALSCMVSGGGSSYSAGSGIDITNGGISVKVDSSTISFDASGNLTVAGGGITIDSALSSTSDNPVQNKVIYSAIGDLESLLSSI